MSGGRGPNESWQQPKDRRKKKQQEGIGFKFDGGEATFACRKSHRGRQNSPLTNRTLERKRSSTTCVCGDGAEAPIPMKFIALSANDGNGKFQNTNAKYASVKVRKAMVQCWEMEAQAEQSRKSMGTNDKFRNTPIEHELELEVNKLITSMSDNVPHKRRRKKHKPGTPTCHFSSSSEERDRGREGSESTLTKKTQLNLNVDYIANKRIISSFGSQYPSKKEKHSTDASRNQEGDGRTRSPSPNKYQNHNNHKLKNQNPPMGKNFRNTSTNERDRYDPEIAGRTLNLHNRTRTSSPKNLKEYSTFNKENSEDGNHAFKCQNEDSLARKISLKAKQIGTTTRLNTCECNLAIIGYKRYLHSRIRSASPRNFEEYPTFDEENLEDSNHTLEYQNDESLRRKNLVNPKEMGTTRRLKTCDSNLEIEGWKRNLHNRTRSSSPRNSTLNYGGNEEIPEDGNHTLKYQDEEHLANHCKPLQKKGIGITPRLKSCEGDLEVVGRRRNLQSRIGSRSPINSEERSTLPHHRENEEHPYEESPIKINLQLEKFRNTPTNSDLQMDSHNQIRCKPESEMKIHPTFPYHRKNETAPSEADPIKINLHLEKFRNTPEDKEDRSDLHESNHHNPFRWKEEVELKVHPTLSVVDENEELSALDENQPKQAPSNPLKTTESKNYHNWDRVAPERTGSFAETAKALKRNLVQIPEENQHHIIEMYFGNNFKPPRQHVEKKQSDTYQDLLENTVRAAFADQDHGEESPKQALEEPSQENHNEDKRYQIEDGGKKEKRDSHVTPTRFTSRMDCQKCNGEIQLEKNLTERYGESNFPTGKHIDYSLNPTEQGSSRRKLAAEEKSDQIGEDTVVGVYSRTNYQHSEREDVSMLLPNPPLLLPLLYHREDGDPSEENRAQLKENCACCHPCPEASPQLGSSGTQSPCVYEMLSSCGDHLEETQEFICTCSYAGGCFKRDFQKPRRESEPTNDRPSPGNHLEQENHQDEGRAQLPSSDENRGPIEDDFGFSLHTKPQIYSVMGVGATAWTAAFINQNRAETVLSEESLSVTSLKRNLGLDTIHLGTSPKTSSLNSAHVNFSDLSKTRNSSEPMEFANSSPFPELDSNRGSLTFLQSADSRSVDTNTNADPLAMAPQRGSIMEPSSSTERGPQEVKYGLLLPPNRSPLKILLVFIQTDPVSDAMSRAADKLGFDVTFSSSYDGALEEFLSKLHDLVVIDTRTSAKSLDFDTLCRSIRNTKGSQHTAVVAIVKKSAFDKDDVTVLSLLDAGYNRCIVETSNIVHCVNELIQLKHSDMRPMAQAATSQALYAALDKCRDIVLITDDSYRLQYANRASERNLGYRHDETLGKTLQEQLIQDPAQVNTMGSSLMRAREWQGPISLRRKGQEATVSVCKAVPITCAGRAPTHFVMVMDLSGIVEQPMAATPDKPRGSVHSIRRVSTDVRSVGSDFLRRTSLAKLSALPLEAPITKIITLLAQAQEQSNPQVVTIIDKAVEILHSTELYSPHVKDDLKLRSDEPVTSDLISALLTQPHQPSVSISSRRSSNDSSSVIRNSNRPISKIKIPSQIKDLLDTSLTWEFDIFRLEELTNKRPLVHLGLSLFLHFDVPATLNCDEKTLINWLTVIEVNYHADNAYHNSTHASDVMQATAGFLEKDRLKSIMEPLDEATSLLAACAHDIDHPGKSSAFLSNCDNPLAILYNDVTVLENHHAALTFKLTLGDDRVNIFRHLDRETYKVARHNVIDMILATEMTKHFEHLAKFVNVFCAKTSRTDLETEEYIPITLPENITLVKRMMIKCADVSNPTRPLRLCVEWARRIAEEYFTQTDEEKARGLPVVMPMFDRTTCSIPKSQIGFVDYIVHDMFEAWDAFIDMPELVTYMRQNYIRWKEFDEQGHTTTADVRKLQNTVLMVPMFPSKNPPKRSE